MKKSPIKEQALNPERAISESPNFRAEPGGSGELDSRLLSALDAASDKKALNPIVLDLRNVASFTDYFVITSGTNERQVQAIATEVAERAKKDGNPVARMEGFTRAEWILLDFGDFIVHVFEEKARRFYDLERLWREAQRIEVPAS